MIKQLTLFCTFAIFILAVGGAVTSAQAHCQEEGSGLPHTGDHPHCTKEPLIYDEYDVVIDIIGSVLPGVGLKWVYDGKSVGSLRPRDDILDMIYFDGEPSPFDTGVLASVCFNQNGELGDPEIPDPAAYPEVRFGGFLQKHRKSTARGMFWFPGRTNDSADGVVLYLLIIEGTFTGDSGVGFPKNGKIMHMTDWTLKKEGGGEASSRACEGSGEFPPSGFDVTFSLITPSE